MIDYFFFYRSWFGVISKNILPFPPSKTIFSYVFFQRFYSFKFYICPYGSVWVYFCMWYRNRKEFFFLLHLDIPLFQVLLLKRIFFFFNVITFTLSSKINLPLVWAIFWTLSCVSFFSPISHCLDYMTW